MQVGDLVKYKNLHGHVVDGKFISKGWTGIIIETGVFAGNKDIKVMWDKMGINTEDSNSLEVISASR